MPTSDSEYTKEDDVSEPMDGPVKEAGEQPPTTANKGGDSKLNTEVQDVTIRDLSQTDMSSAETTNPPAIFNYDVMDQFKDSAEAYKCRHCGKVFQEESFLELHEEIHLKPYACKICNKKFRFLRALHSHRDVHMATKRHSCPQCKKSFRRAATLKIHLAAHRNDSDESDFEKPLAGEKSSENNAAASHPKSEGKSHVCDMCDEAFEKNSELILHKGSVHLDDRPAKCDQCDKSFKRSQDLYHHKKYKHSDERPYKCKICGKGFLYPSIRQKHYQTHTDETSTPKRLKCKICGKSFHDRLKLKRHARVHANESPHHACERCDMFFPTVSALSKHQKKCADEYEHLISEDMCYEVCPEAFNALMAFKKAGHICTDDGPHECALYDALILLKDNSVTSPQLQTHACNFCKKQFVSKSQLQNHLLIHAGVKPYGCHLCPDRFSNRLVLMEHVNTEHMDET